ncbi:hypothetical protein [Polaribacter sp. WD7]|uniref:hypothetical protein n=1 Tax=Polaribacter sp. WD7 TaxID=2269061 RepID=UPI0011BFAD09|nr:hypothetical protein [Polaribacter sp. WD7]
MKNIAKFPKLFFVITFLILYLITYLCGIENPMLRTVFSITLAFILSPKKKKIKTQTGEQIQITWLFLKKPIILE